MRLRRWYAYTTQTTAAAQAKALVASKGRFGPGNKGGGRPKGVPNKLTQNMKNLIQDELVRLGPDHFHAWALENPTEFYKIAARLIPAAREISGREGGPLEHRSIREYSTEAL